MNFQEWLKSNTADVTQLPLMEALEVAYVCGQFNIPEDIAKVMDAVLEWRESWQEDEDCEKLNDVIDTLSDESETLITTLIAKLKEVRHD